MSSYVSDDVAHQHSLTRVFPAWANKVGMQVEAGAQIKTPNPIK